MPEIISRKEARVRGLSHYFTGKPCLRGHIAERELQGNCCECQKLRFQKVIYRYPYKLKIRQCVVCSADITGIKSNTNVCSGACRRTRRLILARQFHRTPEQVVKRRARERNYYSKNKKIIAAKAKLYHSDPLVKRKYMERRKMRLHKAFAALRALEELGIQI